MTEAKPSDDVPTRCHRRAGSDLGRGADRHRGSHRGPGGHAAAGRQRRRGRDPRARGDVGIREQPAATAEAFFGDWFRPATAGVLRDGTSTSKDGSRSDHPRWREHRPAEIEQVLARIRRSRCRLLWRAGRQVRRARRSGGDAPRRRRARGPDRALPPAGSPLSRCLPRSTCSRRSRARLRARFSGAGRGVHRAAPGRRMKFAVLGAGAIGAYVGAALARGAPTSR